MSAIAVITARGGSKRIPRKNIKDFCGKPIIAYSIEAACTAGCFDEIMCSTDDPDITRIAERYGAKVPFFRSSETSGDFATTADVLVEVIDRYRALGREFDYMCGLYPTAPFVDAGKIVFGLNEMVRLNANGAVPVVRFSYPIQRALMISDGQLSMISPEHLNSRSQDLTPAYHDAGQYYWYRVSAFMENPNILTQCPIPIITPEIGVQDIDTEEDWELAEMKFRLLKHPTESRWE